MPQVHAFLTNCRLADGRVVDIGIAGGKIVIVGEGAAASSNSAPALDIGGDLILPGLVDGHMHLDKTLAGLPWMGHAAGPTRMSRIEQVENAWAAHDTALRESDGLHRDPVTIAFAGGKHALQLGQAAFEIDVDMGAQMRRAARDAFADQVTGAPFGG